MSPPGDADLLVAARRVLLDALDALAAHRDALVVIGAQAIYLHTGEADVALAEATKDSDLVDVSGSFAVHAARVRGWGS